ncbi:MAG: CBS domain-containing protein [Armatimonadota bacterium]
MDVAVCHVNADFDSLGGLVGAARLYPGATMVLPGGESPPVRDFLTLHREVLAPRTPAEIDAEAITRVIVVDTSSRGRLGPAAEWLDLPGVAVHLYDHHLETQLDFQPVLSRRERWGAVSSIIAHALRDREITPTPVEATALLLGIYEDTGSLSYAGTTPEDLEAAAWLVRLGGDLDVVAQFTRRLLTPAQRELLLTLLANLQVREIRGAALGFAWAPPGPHVEDAAVLAHRLLDAEETEAVFILLQSQDRVHLIGRSRSDAVDVGGTLRELGGGGHARAASARFRGEAAESVMARLQEAVARHVTPEPVARELMAYPVRSVSPEDTVDEARRRMIRYGHSGLLVMEGGRMQGVVTRRDVDKARHHRLEHAPVRGFMTREVRSVSPETPLSELERIMLQDGIGRLPVLRGATVVGIVTRTDLLRARHGPRYLAGSPPHGEEPVAQLLRERLPARVQRLLEKVGTAAQRQECEAYVVGGFVRDLILDVRNLDVDILVEPDALPLAQAFAEAAEGALTVEERFGTAKVRLPDGFPVDFATARTESYAHPGALPDVERSSVVDDLRRRDFTINALAVALRPERFGELLDPFGGRADLDRRRLRVLHALSFHEDPTRLFRAARFEERFHFRMDGHTEALAREAVRSGAIGRISADRLRRELYLSFREARRLGVLARLQELGVLAWLHPELRLEEPLLQALPGALEWWQDTAAEPVEARLVYLAALLAALGPEGASVLAQERLAVKPAAQRKLRTALATLQERERLLPPHASAAEVTRALEPLPPEALVLLRAGLAGAHEAARATLHRFVAEWRHTKLEITGEDLKALGYRAGPALGAALRATLDAKRNGELSGREAELAYACRLLDEDGRAR